MAAPDKHLSQSRIAGTLSTCSPQRASALADLAEALVRGSGKSYSKKERRNILALSRRSDWLAERYRLTRHSFDGEEMRAINWALDIIRSTRGPWETTDEHGTDGIS
jgi:hypothetical protein